MFYINPRDMDKEQWLSHHALQVDESRIKDFNFESPADDQYFPCVWIINPGFTAAGVAFDKMELNRWFADPDDNRVKRFFLVPKESFFALHPEARPDGQS